jgi:hypothetical protein
MARTGEDVQQAVLTSAWTRPGHCGAGRLVDAAARIVRPVRADIERVAVAQGAW